MKARLPIECSLKDIDKHTFSNERKFNELLLRDIKHFIKSVFYEDVVYATDGKSELKGRVKLKTGQILPLRGVRLDLWVECKSGNNYILEIKNPKHSNYQTISAIGQILGYSIKFPPAKLVIVSTQYDDGFYEVITKYNLPIDFVLVTEDKLYLLKK